MINETIKQKIIDEVGTDVSGKWLSIEKVDQLAELIVNECVDIVYSHRSKMDSGPTYIAHDIKTHFGVK